MSTVPTPLPPGSMTVPPTFGWEQIAGVLVILTVVAVAFLLLGAGLASLNRRSEWQAYLGARSSRRPDPDDRPRELVPSEPGNARP